MWIKIWWAMGLIVSKEKVSNVSGLRFVLGQFQGDSRKENFLLIKRAKNFAQEDLKTRVPVQRARKRKRGNL